MAVIMVAGNAVKIPRSALDSARTLTANIALEMGYATGLHRQALFATGVVLFVVIMILNSMATWAIQKRVRK
jgi:ABC-type phosphate transport system permease subunit